ncbi:MAG: GGDEF domain-containing protein [Elusimicrobiota bacterium]|jgi:diguanylate cyclase (GGDEF)-like protein
MIGFYTWMFTAGLVLALGLVYWFGVAGWVVSAILLVGGWSAVAMNGTSDPAILAVQVLVAVFVMWFSLRWTLRHQSWQERSAKDQAESDEKQRVVQTAIQDIREKIAAKAAEVEKGLKQYELVKKLAEAVSLEEMTPSLERSLKYFFRAEGWALYLTNERGELQQVQRRGITPDPRAEDLPKQEPYLHTFVIQGDVDQGRCVWALGLPLWRLHERVGLLLIRLPEFSPDQQAAILAEANTFAVQLIFAMAKAKLYQELEGRSRTDGLTGLSRRGPFEERLKEEVARAQSFRSTFSILMIDIDHFKNLNDTYGHQVGDEVLRTVAQRIREGLYETDVIARYGGEEFVCLLPRSDPAGLRIKADQIRQRVGAQSYVIGLEAIQVTISIGIAHFPQDGATAQAVMAAADRALYAAKDAGRNCVVEAASVSS